MGDTRDPIGVVLAGGAGRRIGGAKALVELRGIPLLHYPLRALQAVLSDVVVVAKDATELPPLGDVEVWVEPARPRHPLAGVVHALTCAGASRDVLVCAGDLPLLTPDVVARVAQADAHGAPALVPRADGRLQPLLARYAPAARAPLAAALAHEPLPSLTDAVAALAPYVVELDDARACLNVNTPADLRAAAGLPDHPSG